jgi:hypothetical protein
MLVYWRGGQPQLEGLLLGIAFGGVATGLVLWANGLMHTGPFVEEREKLIADRAVAEALRADLERHGIQRRRCCSAVSWWPGPPLGRPCCSRSGRSGRSREMPSCVQRGRSGRAS